MKFSQGPPDISSSFINATTFVVHLHHLYDMEPLSYHRGSHALLQRSANLVAGCCLLNVLSYHVTVTLGV